MIDVEVYLGLGDKSEFHRQVPFAAIPYTDQEICLPGDIMVHDWTLNWYWNETLGVMYPAISIHLNDMSEGEIAMLEVYGWECVYQGKRQ
jgi:hypothetical protein